MQKQRKSNIELFRIICMLMIVFSHATQYQGGNWFWDYIQDYPISLNVSFSMVLGGCGQLAVIGYVAITAYFMCDKETVNIYKIVLLILETIILNLLVRLSVLIWYGDITAKKMVDNITKSLLSPISGEYWFITGYLFFSFLLPLLQCITREFSEIRLRKCVIVLSAVVLLCDWFYIRCGGTIVDFIYLYLLIAYLKKYKDKWMNNNCKKLFLVSFFTMMFAMFFLKISADILHHPSIAKYVTKIFVNWNALLILAGVALFYIFKNIDMKSSKLINEIGSATLGVYILHENNVLGGVNSLLWVCVLKLDKCLETVYYPLFLLVCVCSIFIATIIISLAYKYIVEGILNKTQLKSFCNRFSI